MAAFQFVFMTRREPLRWLLLVSNHAWWMQNPPKLKQLLLERGKVSISRTGGGARHARSHRGIIDDTAPTYGREVSSRLNTIRWVRIRQET